MTFLLKIRFALEFIAIRGLLTLLALPPLPIAKALGRAMGRFILALGVRRRTVMGNLEIAFPEKSPAEREAIARGCYEHFGRTLVEILSFPRWSDERIARSVTLIGMEHIEAARREGRGVVIAVPHLGCFDVVAVKLALEGIFLTNVYQGVRNPYIDRWIMDLRTMRGALVAKRGIQMRETFTKLRKGGVVGILPDQDAGPHGLFIPFFGRAASTLQGPAELALRTGAVLITACTPVTAEGYSSIFEPPIANGTIEEMMTEVNQRLENSIRRWPEQYFWLHKRWKSRPPDESASQQAPGGAA